MAAELPSVSTPIADVAKPYGHVVAIAHGHEQFVAACEEALARTPDGAAELRGTMRAIVAGTSWDVTADGMRRLIASTAPRQQAPRFAPRHRPRPARQPAPRIPVQ